LFYLLFIQGVVYLPLPALLFFFPVQNSRLSCLLCRSLSPLPPTVVESPFVFFFASGA